MLSRILKNILKEDLAFPAKAEEGLWGKGWATHSWHQVSLLQRLVAVSLSGFHCEGTGLVTVQSCFQEVQRSVEGEEIPVPWGATERSVSQVF